MEVIREPFVFVITEIVKEYAAYSSCLPTMGDEEIFVAPFFERRVQIATVLIARLFQRCVKVNRVFFEEIRWSQITTSPKPPGENLSGSLLSFGNGFRDLEVPVIGMHSRGARITRVHDETDCESGS